MTDTIATNVVVRDGRAVSFRVRRCRLSAAATQGRAAISYEHASPVLRIGSRPGNDLVVADPSVSRVHAEITLDVHGFRLRDLGSTNGTYVDGYRTSDIYLRPGSLVRLGHAELRFEPLADEVEVPLSSADRFGSVVGRSAAMRHLFAVLERSAPSDVTMLLEGESGTGKELLAEAIHGSSRRAGGPLVVFDCASVPMTLVESELFGHEKGAFTGASGRRIGRLEEADGGTLFLDEIGELPLELQPRLLRALEKRELRRVGGSQTLRVDVRIVAATNRDLAREVNRGTFREDLFYRLAVVRVVVPPLRDRADDIPPLVEHFVRRALRDDPARAARVIAGVSPDNYRRLASHPWPGNVRELRNVIERTLVLSDPGGAAERFDPAPAASGPRAPAPPASSPDPAANAASPGTPALDRPFVDAKADVLARFEESYLVSMLERHGGNISRAAAAAGLDRMYFKRLLRKYRGD